ncbi:murein hydrolase activator EnvC family protein [Thalassotalea fusca]
MLQSPSTLAALYRQDESQSNKQLDSVKSEIAKQKAQIRQVDTELTSLQKQLHQKDLAVAKVAKSLQNTQQKLEETKQTLAELEKQAQSLTEKKAKQEDILATQLRTAYSTGHHDYLKLILNQQEPANVQRTVTYYQYLNDARMKQIDGFKETINKLQQVTKEQEQQSAKYEALAAQQITQQQELQTSITSQKAVVQAMNQRLKTGKQRLAQLEQEEQALVAALEELARKHKASLTLEGLANLKKKLSWPVKGKIQRSFGSRKQGYLKWKGVLIAAPVGRTVKTIHNGTVIFADWLKGYGLVTVVDHGKGYMSLYGHNQTLLKSVGDRVETGEPIALAGQSGGQAQPALYFEIRHNGQAVNPKLWCK